ncbi:MAG: hypothetical protein COV47_01305 [Candidatus Diapherotrites archaeon CG11_big_fil_rev_8_21_14_0_20_37_9]|nr:MAG: hypothetical protein COV47_01305 [Candidatus Diapherotrites archaeon CG11_big_fil_rev_8_21_14_0_20_37_9]
MKLTAQNIVKKHLFLSLSNVLVPGLGLKEVSKEKAHALLKFLSGIEKSGFISIYLVSGMPRENAEKAITDSGIGKFFKKENIFLLSKDYLDSKDELDRARHEKNVKDDPDFVDEYFKQHVFMDFISLGKCIPEEMAFVGNDIWFDAFYTTRFSKIDFFIVKEALCERNRLMPADIKGLNYVSLSEADFRKIIVGKFPSPDLQPLENYVFNKLKLELFQGTQIENMVNKSVLSKGNSNK